MPPVKFLLVDDLEENLVALEALLERDGLEILKARSGREALELLLDARRRRWRSSTCRCPTWTASSSPS